MKHSISWTIITALTLVATMSPARAAGSYGALPSAGESTPATLDSATHSARVAGPVSVSSGAEASAKWIIDRADNICGLDDAKMLSKPAKVDYDVLLKATTEMKKIRDDKIDPGSPEGIRLRQAAVDRVKVAADKVRVAEGYCSVWKQVRHQDGRAIPDITDLVKAQL